MENAMVIHECCVKKKKKKKKKKKEVSDRGYGEMIHTVPTRLSPLKAALAVSVREEDVQSCSSREKRIFFHASLSLNQSSQYKVLDGNIKNPATTLAPSLLFPISAYLARSESLRLVACTCKAHAHRDLVRSLHLPTSLSDLEVSFFPARRNVV